MGTFSKISLISNDSEIINELIKLNAEVSMVSFCKEKVISEEYVQFGNFELDILAINKLTNKIVMIDHDDASFVMGYVANSLSEFIKALTIVENYFERCELNEDLFEDEEYLKNTLEDCIAIVENIEYKWFYEMILGIE